MKLGIDVDRAAQEARAFFGRPDVKTAPDLEARQKVSWSQFGGVKDEAAAS